MPLPIVAIVGRPNVGKSTLFNRILKRRLAVVDPAPGVTRDRHYADAVWNDVRFTLVDTGGFILDREGDELASAVREQTLIAAEEADLVIFVTDAQASSSDTERGLAKILLKRKTPVIYVANKVDDLSMIGLIYEQALPGVAEPLPVSAKNGYQVAELLDLIADRLHQIQPVQPEAETRDELAVAIIGAPNSGKSSLVNLLAQEKRMVVSDIPGTTRDSVDTMISYHGKPVRLIDTAGLRRKRQDLQGLEFYCTIRALRAMDRADVAVILVDASVGLSQRDIRLAAEAASRGVGVIVAVNKWDVVEKDERTSGKWVLEWRSQAPTLDWAPMEFISAQTGQRAIKVIEAAFEVKAEREKRISTQELNNVITPLLERTPPPAIKGKFIKVKYITQAEKAPPHFIFFASHADIVGPGYYRFVERLIREQWTFKGVPIKVSFRNKGSRDQISK